MSSNNKMPWNTLEDKSKVLADKNIFLKFVSTKRTAQLEC
jgi:hypothetical protein